MSVLLTSVTIILQDSVATNVSVMLLDSDTTVMDWYAVLSFKGNMIRKSPVQHKQFLPLRQKKKTLF